MHSPIRSYVLKFKGLVLPYGRCNNYQMNIVPFNVDIIIMSESVVGV